MVYRVTDEHDNIIASAFTIKIRDGVLMALDENRTVDLFLAPGQWASAFWEES